MNGVTSVEKEYRLSFVQKMSVWFFFSFYCICLVSLITQLIFNLSFLNFLMFLGELVGSVIFPATAYFVFGMNYGFTGAKAMFRYLINTLLRRTPPPLMVNEEVIARAQKMRRRFAVAILTICVAFMIVISIVPFIETDDIKALSIAIVSALAAWLLSYYIIIKRF